MDDQGGNATCTRHSIAKAITHLLHHGLFTIGGKFGGQRIDVSQSEVVSTLNQLHGDNSVGKYPWEFDSKKIEILTKNKKERLQIELTVKQLVYKEVLDFGKHSYIIVKPKCWWKSPDPQHCLFAQSFDPATREFRCLNSHGNQIDPNPSIPETEVNNIHRVAIQVDRV